MPCNTVVRGRAKKLSLKVPQDITEQEVRDVAGAIDHEDFHRIMDGMSDADFIEFVRKLWARRKRRAEAATAHVIQEAPYA